MNFPREAGPNTRRHIIEAACHLFRSKGYDNTTLLDLLNMAQVEDRIFFLHFQSLDELLEVVWSES